MFAAQVPLEDASTFFDVLDLDGSGTIDADEFTALLEALDGGAGGTKEAVAGSDGCALTCCVALYRMHPVTG